MSDKLLGALSMSKRAGALQVGFDAVRGAVRGGKASLVAFAQDVSPGTQKRVMDAAQALPEKARPAILLLPFTQAQLAQITIKPAGTLAVTNKDLAVLCLKAAGQPIEPRQPE